jgi:hypothetical protein
MVIAVYTQGNAMTIDLYFRLGYRSKRAMLRTKGRVKGGCYEHAYYSPRWDLLERLSRETGLTPEECERKLQQERIELLRESGFL